MQRAFISTWTTSTNGDSITIPTIGDGYDYRVDWGDGAKESGFTGDAWHTYALEGTYKVSITGYFPRIYFKNTSDRSKIQNIEQWGDIVWRSMENAFAFCNRLSITAPDSPDLSRVMNLSRMFFFATEFNESIGHWDVSSITNMESLFQGCSCFNHELNNWNVSKVTNMKAMFSNASAFNKPLYNWNVSRVTSMQKMFAQASSFDQYLNGWDISGLTDMQWMFAQASSFNQELNAWDVSKIMDMQWMFVQATSFNQDLSRWDVSSVTTMRSMFMGANSFNQSLANWNISQVINISEMLFQTALSTMNYDSTLNGWASLVSLPKGMYLKAYPSTYAKGKASRQKLINEFNWTIMDDGEALHPEAV